MHATFQINNHFLVDDKRLHVLTMDNGRNCVCNALSTVKLTSGITFIY